MTSLVPQSAGDLAPKMEANDVVAFMVRCGEEVGLQIVPSWKGIVGRHAKLMLEDGIPQDVVCGACWLAILRGKPQVAQYIAGDLLLATTGNRLSEQEYEQKLALFAAGNGDRRLELLDEQRARRAAREAEIGRRRNGG